MVVAAGIVGKTIEKGLCLEENRCHSNSLILTNGTSHYQIRRKWRAKGCPVSTEIQTDMEKY